MKLHYEIIDAVWYLSERRRRIIDKVLNYSWNVRDKSSTEKNEHSASLMRFSYTQVTVDRPITFAVVVEDFAVTIFTDRKCKQAAFFILF